MNNEKPFYNKKGELTSYGLACGYIEQFEHLQQRVTLWKEHNAYHVRRHNFFRNKRVFWDSFETLTEARKRYNESSKEIKSLCYIPS